MKLYFKENQVRCYDCGKNFEPEAFPEWGRVFCRCEHRGTVAQTEPDSQHTVEREFNDLEVFLKMGKFRGFIGLPSDDFFKSYNGEPLRFEGAVGDVSARCYWAEKDFRESLVGGCISVPTLDMIQR